MLFRSEFEDEHGDDESRSNIARLMPKRVKRRRRVENEATNSDAGWEEYFDYIFPEDESAKPNLKLLAMAKMWKKQKEVDPEEPEIKAEPVTTNPDAIDIDADDDDIRNESSSGSEDESNDDDGSPPEKRKKENSCDDDASSED